MLTFFGKLDVGSTSTHNPTKDATKKKCRKTQFQKSYATLSEEKKEILRQKKKRCIEK